MINYFLRYERYDPLKKITANSYKKNDDRIKYFIIIILFSRAISN